MINGSKRICSHSDGSLIDGFDVYIALFIVCICIYNDFNDRENTWSQRDLYIATMITIILKLGYMLYKDDEFIVRVNLLVKLLKRPDYALSKVEKYGKDG